MSWDIDIKIGGKIHGTLISKSWGVPCSSKCVYRSRAMPLLAMTMMGIVPLMGIVVFSSTRTMPLFVSGFIRNVPRAKK